WAKRADGRACPPADDQQTIIVGGHAGCAALHPTAPPTLRRAALPLREQIAERLFEVGRGLDGLRCERIDRRLQGGPRDIGTLRGPHGAQRNAGASVRVAWRSRISLRFIRATHRLFRAASEFRLREDLAQGTARALGRAWAVYLDRAGPG